MKKLVLFALAGLMSLSAMAQDDAIQKHFSQYWNDDDFTTIHLTRKMFEIVAEIPVEEDEDEVLSVIRSLNGMRMITTERDADKHYRDALNKLKGSSYEELMVVRDEGQNIEFLILEESDGKISELVLVGQDDDGDKDFFLLSLTGDIDLKQIAKLSSTLNIEGMEELENLEDHR
ncbi:MAG TPA: hypothetical protein DCE41_17710 [Cytophagales bacterium]|nr:hypothetical protein [Cytophagales bacterium]HAA23695.1 hypothetical protein [Cytophagales bacterium]HAP62867.1 hypothetical protein [Cytophagales bacterium]